MNALLKYIATEPVAATGFAGIYIFGSMEIVIQFCEAGHPAIAACFAATVIIFTKCNFKRLMAALRKAKAESKE